MRTTRHAGWIGIVSLLGCAAPAVDTPDAGDAGPSGPLGLETQTTACPRIGALDRVVVKHLDFVAGHCVTLTLVAPGEHTNWPEVTLSPTDPYPWGIEFAALLPGGSCERPSEAGVLQAERLRGTVTLHTPDGGFMPATLDVDLEFTTGTTRTTIRATNVAIAGSC